MSRFLASEQSLMAELDALTFVAGNVQTGLQSLNHWLSSLLHTLHTQRLSIPAGMCKTHSLAPLIDDIEAALKNCRHIWAQQWQDQAAVRGLADSFEPRVILLVFGKFNAGKSAFCNLLAERFSQHGEPVRFFHLEGGQIVTTDHALQEGATETTACLQGVYLGSRLALMDTPGLHSVTLENAELTRRFIDSADGVLWLTSSTSPGQVQELQELARELHRHKPLLPVITRSDVIEEDEVNGQIVKLLCNKNPANRSSQEEDVHARALEKLRDMGVDEGLLCSPVSISAYMARQQGQTPTALEAAGYARLYESLLRIVQPVVAYKQRKSVEMLLHHLEENVWGSLSGQVLPRLLRLKNSLTAEQARLLALPPCMLRGAWKTVMPELPALLAQHMASDLVPETSTYNASALYQDLSRISQQAVQQQTHDHLDGYCIVWPDTTVQLPPQNHHMTYARLHAAWQTALSEQMQVVFDMVCRQCADSLGHLIQGINGLLDALAQYPKELHVLKGELRACPRVN